MAVADRAVRTSMPVLLAVSCLVVFACRSSRTCAEVIAAGPPDTRAVHRTPHRALLLERGFESLAQRAALLRGAATSLDLQTSRWGNGVAGRFVLAECIAAARRGVQVRLLLDGLSCELDGGLIAAATAQQERLQVRWYNPAYRDIRAEARVRHAAIDTSAGRLSRRMHVNLLVADGRYAITGGRAIEDSCFDLDPGRDYLDRDLLIEGAVTADMRASFDAFWADELTVPSTDLAPLTATDAGDVDLYPLLNSDSIAELRTGISALLRPADLWLQPPVEVTGVGFHTDPPGNPGRDDGEVTSRAVHYLLCTAEDTIHVQCPYFVTTDAAKGFFAENQELEFARQILVHTNSLAATGNWATYAAYQAEKRQLSGFAALTLYELKPTPADRETLLSSAPAAVALRSRDGRGPARPCVHTKSLVVDRRVALIGSFHLDDRAANINAEATLEIDDPAIAGPLAAAIEAHMAPGNSWVAATRRTPLGPDAMDDLMASTSPPVLRFLFADRWPIENTSLFDLRSDEQPCRPSDPGFFKRYQAVGSFPRASDSAPSAEIERTGIAEVTPVL